jgi:hypothetical protein
MNLASIVLMAEPVSVIYPPPREGLPFLIVTILTADKVVVVPTRSRNDARAAVTKLSRTRRAKEPYEPAAPPE